MNDAVLTIEHPRGRFKATAAMLPVSIGGDATSDVVMVGVTGQIQIGRLDELFFVQAGKAGTAIRVNGELVAGSRRLKDNDQVAFDTARLDVSMQAGRMEVVARSQVTAGHTAPPDLEDLARAGANLRDDEVEIAPISFRVDAAAQAVRSTFKPTIPQIAVGSAFALLAILAWFAFTAKSVEFVFEGAASEVELPSTLFQFRFGDRYMLRSGRHPIAAERDGYYPLRTEVVVGDAASQSLELAFVKLPGLVTITTDPVADVSVTLDGRRIGTAPLRDYEIPPGEHKLEFSLPRHFPEVITIDVAGAHARQAVRATLTPNWAPVSISTTPEGADVLIDGRVSGKTPLAVELDEGDYEIEVRLGGYNAWRSNVAVTANEPLALPPIQLEQADGRLRLVSEPSGAAISLNGDYMGTTPLNLRLRPGRTHTVVASKPGFETVSQQLSVAADSGRTVQLDLTALFGTVSITSDPPGASVWVDGEQVGATPATFELSTLPHQIEVRLQGYAIARRELTPREGLTHALDFDLELLDDTTGDGYRRILTSSLGQEMQIVPAGEFTMGSSRREQGRRSNEVLRPVKLTRAFYLGTKEVTNAEFRAFRPTHDSGEFAGQSLNGDDQPVVNVTWNDVVEYLNWLSIKDGLQPVYEQRADGWAPVVPLRNGYRLPTEAEWEWAARFASRPMPLVYPWSADAAAVAPSDRSGNFADVSAAKILPTSLYTYNDDFPVTAPVGSFDADVLGLYDMGGNVAEWVLDFYALDLAGSNTVVENPLGPTSGTYHVVRGSSWRSATMTDLRVASRSYGNSARDDLGFRIARNLSGQ